MRIAVISGKGGTGKSCVASAIALSLRSCILVDADVDCPNQFLIFGGTEVHRRGFSASKLAVIGKNRPVEKDCAGVCEFGAIAREGNMLRILDSRCEGCGACAIAFPELGIGLVPRKSAELMVVDAGRFPLVYGKLVPGEAGSGKVVFELKRIVEEMAARKNVADTVIDAPAGVGCPVIAAVTGCDYVIGVVEPTPAGMSNLERALDVVRHFGIPFRVVLNKRGISKSHERKIAGRYGKLLLASIPYDEEIPRLLAEGRPPSLGRGAAAAALRRMAKKAAGAVGGRPRGRVRPGKARTARSHLNLL